MFNFSKMAAVAPSAVTNLVNHLLAQTVSKEQATMADFYVNGVQPSGLLREVAEDVAAGKISLTEGTEILLVDWEKTHPEPDPLQFAQWMQERHPHGVPPDQPVSEQRFEFAQQRRFEATQQRWDEARLNADVDLFKRLDVLSDRIASGIADTPLAIVRPGTDPKVLLGLGIEQDQLLSRHEIAALLVGRKTHGELIEGKTYAPEKILPMNPKTGAKPVAMPIGSFDFCATPDKSISVVWALASPPEQAQILGAHIEAGRFAMDYLAQHIGQARTGKDGAGPPEPGDITWIEFHQHTARKVAVSMENGEVVVKTDTDVPGDPELHTHYSVPNAVFTQSGRVGSLDTSDIKGFLKEVDLVYQARYATLLREKGFAADFDEKRRAAVMPIIPDILHKHFSKRSEAGEMLARKYTTDKGEVWEDLSDAQRRQRMDVAMHPKEQQLPGFKHDDKANFPSWHAQAKELGWEQPKTMHLYGPPPPPLSQEQADRKSYETALPWLDERLQQRTVLKHYDLRVAALHGRIRFGLSDVKDIDRVTKLMRTDGVRQYGVNTALIWGKEDEKRYVSVTTELHASEEKELIQLIKRAARDTSQAIPADLLAQKVRESGRDFTDAHGQAQLEALTQAGTGGKFALVVAAAGAGKTTSLEPLVASWDAQQRPVYGEALAWRTADELSDTGINKRAAMASAVMLQAAEKGELNLHERSVVVIDEFGMQDRRQILHVMRQQAKLGFSVVALGDDRQTGSIGAGGVIALARKALGDDQVPEISTTRRQKSDREKEIAGLFRDNEAKKALDMKRDDGSVHMVYGGRSAVIAQVAADYGKHLQATGDAPMAYAPTNSDAHQISEALRLERRKLGMVKPDQISFAATDGERDYTLRIAPGDKLRLFKSTGARYANGKGGAIGRNGSVVEVIEANKEGMLVKSKTGKEGFVTWDKVPTAHGRVKLSYGDATTVHAIQGATGKKSLVVLPLGSQAFNGGTGYTALTRHEFTCDLYTSESAERIAVKQARPVNDARPITEDDKWAVVATNLQHAPKRDSALEMMQKVEKVYRGTVSTLEHNAALTVPPQAAEVASVQRQQHHVVTQHQQISPVSGVSMSI